MPAAIKWTKQLESAICERIMAGESVCKIAKDKSMPCESSIWVHAGQDEEFQSAIVRAMEIRTEMDMERLVDLADTADEDNANAVKLKVWTRMWIAGKRKPKKYGEKIQQEHTGEVGIKTILVKSSAKDNARPATKPEFEE